MLTKRCAVPSYDSINSDPNRSLITSASSDSVIQGAQRGEETRVYKRRWYILLLLSLMCGTQGCVWNTFGPISATAEDAFGWDTGNIGMLTNWGPISFILGAGPLIWVLEHKGLRVACLASAFFIAAGTVARVFTMDGPAVTILMNLGQGLNGLAGLIAMAGPPVLSAVWFPPHQRTTATAIGGFFGTLGTAAGFLIGPLLVPDVPRNSSHPADIDFSFDSLLQNESRHERIEREKDAIHQLMYIECGWACALFLAMVIYFPKKPPLPPSASAALQREDLVTGLLRVCRCPQFWLIGIIYGLSTGVLNCWSSLLAVLLQPHGIGEAQAGWIAFAATCGGCTLSILVAVLADYMKRAMKWFVLMSYVLGTAGFTVFTLAAEGYITASTLVFIVSVIGGTTAVYASTPLLYELVCEAVYPAGEGTANGILTLLNNIAGGVFLLIMLDPDLGTGWMNWVLVAVCAQCIPLLLVMKVRYNRLDLDEHNPSLTSAIVVQPPPPSAPAPAPAPAAPSAPLV
ncbi:hypothetical protein ACOMHN_065810 [Nucella lapillus]